jgi:hypothetical protein
MVENADGVDTSGSVNGVGGNSWSSVVLKGERSQFDAARLEPVALFPFV